MAEALTSEEVAKELGRDVRTVQRYGREEGLIFRRDPKTGRRLVTREDLSEWLGREEIQAMLAVGNILHNKGPKRKPRRSVASIAVASLTTVAIVMA